MSQPLELCLEDVAVDELQGGMRYLRCVALCGRQPGLGIDPAGNVTWRTAAELAAEIWVSGDERLILLRPAGAPAVRLTRAERVLDLPEGKPVVTLDGDRIEVGPRCLRVHLHGVAQSVHAPTPLAERVLSSAARAAAVVAMGAAVASCARPSAQPQTPAPQTMATAPQPPGTPPPSASAPIEVRQNPPGATANPDWQRQPPPGTPPAPR